ncbi:LOW QUALITY PROTEIN: isoprene synthase, chloroplastic-like [Citrus clementina]|uniref:LOW QUALITY PROTEIN: isoprene synthase, chloroplastic-like n=1 Tax=Citrus clementina TaxID=85681 RepID=UPI000CED3D48|nr:LOW QUALITY PROTEIN: isoprene synthase, chloroplastic-like [Citrus x clementina]
MVTDLLYFNHPSFLAYKPRRFLKQRNLHRHGAAMAFKVCCSVNPQTSQLTANRRSANYQPPLWEYVLLQSFKTHQVVSILHKGFYSNADDKYQRRAKELEEEVKFMINNENGEMLPILELIDDVQRLGLGYRFENEIKRALHRILSWQGYDHVNPEKDLHVTALRFRLLRQHGFDISQEIFKTFMDLKPEGNFTETVHKDVKGVLSLNEASYLAFEGEDILNEALTFSRTHLNQLKTKLNPYMSELVSHSLELPRHYRMRRLEVRWYTEAYRKKDANCMLLEFAKLDFNRVQSSYQEEIKNLTRWWEDIDLAKNLKFARDRLMECFIWSVGMVPKPQYSNCRRALTKVAAFVTIIDYIYAVYGTLDELELFTYAVERWDINAVNDLPNYMKLSFLALYNTINEMAYDILKQHGEIIIPYLTKAWADLCKSFLQEAKWSYNEYTPTFEEYLENAWRSSSGELSLVHSYFLVSRSINKKALESLGKYHNLIRWPSTIFRLSNDLATSKAESEIGKTASSILCYMHETGLSEEIARQHLRNMIDSCWKKMNKEWVNDQHPFVEPFVETAFNLARIAQCTYQYGDEHGAPDGRAKKRVVISC